MVLAAGKMYRPTAVAFDIATNSVFVVEQFNHRISKWDYTDGNYDFTLDTGWGSNNDGTSGEGAPIGDGSSTDNALYRPSDIVFDPINNLLYVTDTFHNRVRVITAGTGAFTTSLGQGGSGTSDFYHPTGIAIDTLDEFVVIADELNHRAVRYLADGSTLQAPSVLLDPSVTTGLSFIRPHGVVYDVTADEFNISDSLRGVISSYTDTGVFVNQYGTPGTTIGDVNLFYPSSGQGLLGGTTTTVFADTRNNALKTMNNETIAVTTGITAGVGDGQLYYPESASSFVDAATNYVLAANTLNNRVEAYSSTSNALAFQENFGSP